MIDDLSPRDSPADYPVEYAAHGPLPVPAPRSPADASPLDDRPPLANRIRLTSPGEVVAAVPYLFGFHPTASVVGLGMAPPPGTTPEDTRRIFVHGARSDFDPAIDDFTFPYRLATRMEAMGASEVLLLVYPPDDVSPKHAFGGGGSERDLVTTLTSALGQRGILLNDALRVRPGRWWSYHCRNAACCPLEGKVWSCSDVPGLEAAAALAGIVVLPDRAALDATLDPVGGADAVEMRAAFRRETAHDEGWSPRLSVDEVISARRLADRLRLRESGQNVDPTPTEAAALLVALRDCRVRDYMACWAADSRADQLLALSVALARRAVQSQYAPSPYTLASWAAWALGRGALAQLALERALRADPEYSFARLIRRGLDRAVSPRVVRETARATARRLGGAG